MARHFKIIVEKHSDGYVAYPLGMKGVVVGEGDSYEEALADVKSAIRFHMETFGEVMRRLGHLFKTFKRAARRGHLSTSTMTKVREIVDEAIHKLEQVLEKES